ncbi:MAG: sigma-54 dependent transcriptional regulator [Bacteroidota bacterium]
MKKEKATILIIDDDEDVLLSAQLMLKRHYEKVVTAPHPRELNHLLSRERPHLVLLDMNFRLGFNNGEEGLYWLQHIKDVNPDIPVILMTAFGEIELAVEALQLGASDFILKPWENEKLRDKISKALEGRKPTQSIPQGNGQPTTIPPSEFIMGSSSSFQQVMDIVEKVSKTAANVLILGESGTGKQQVARQIHALSDRRDQVFVHVDLGALSENLFESELFGHKKGAFTDAKEDKKGRFEMASGGTIFLDEIGNLPLNLQAKLLSVLQDRKFSRIGEGEERKVDARFIFATNAPLEEWVQEGKFREDLMYRINTIEVPLPALRERKEDIQAFLQHFLKIFTQKYEKSSLQLTREALGALKNYHWPGNIRELQHAMERAVILAEGETIRAADFRFKKEGESTGEIGLNNLNLQEIEKLLIEKALSRNGGNISQAARDLGLTRAALYRRMEKHNL